MVGKGHSGCCCQGNALIGGAQNDIEFNAAVDNALGVIAPQSRQRSTRGESTRIEKIGALTARFERKATETKHFVRTGEVDKFALIGVHGISKKLQQVKFGEYSVT